MRIIGFNFETIKAERIATKDIEKVNVKHKVDLKDIKQDTVKIGKKQNIIKASFKFSVKYEPEVGNIEIHGNILLNDEEKKINEVLENWKKNKKLDKESTMVVMNTILMRSNIKALTMAQDVNLPPHIPLPKITPEVKEDNYIG